MKRLTSTFTLLFLISFSNLSSQEVLTNQSVVELVELGFEESVIIAKIESSETNFDTTIDKLKELKAKGVTPSILKAMMSPSKNKPVAKEPIKKQQAPKPDDTFFYWENGENELVKVQYANSNIIIDENELASYTEMIMSSAKFGLKNALSFRPSMLILRKRLSSDKVLTVNDDTDYVMQLSYYGSNSYGAMGEEFEVIGINPRVKEEEVTTKTTKAIGEAQKYTYKKIKMDGMKVKMKGELHIYENYINLIIDETSFTPETKIEYPIENKTIMPDDSWKSFSNVNGTTSELEYNSKDNKYKNNGGTLTLRVMGTTQVYILDKKE